MRREIIYCNQKTGFLPGHRYANPRFFQGVRQDITSVIVVGSWKDIAAAYRMAGGVDVHEVADPEELATFLRARKKTEAETAPQKSALKPILTEPPQLPQRKPLTEIKPARGRMPVSDAQLAQADEMPWPLLKDMAASLSDKPIGSRADAMAAVNAERRKRGG